MTDTIPGFEPAGCFDLPGHSWRPVDILAAALQPPTPPDILGVYYRGRRHLLSGENEALKSWLMLIGCVEEIRAGNTTLFVDYENGSREIYARARAVGLTDEEIRRQFVYLEPEEPVTDPLIAADVDDLIATCRPSLVAIDSYTGALSTHGLDPNSSLDIEAFDRTVTRRLAASGAAILIADHVTKNRDGRGRYSIGSERKASVCEVHVGAEAIRPFGRGRTGLVKLTVHKDRPGFLPRPTCGELELASDPSSGAITWTLKQPESSDHDTTFRPTILMERVSAFLDRQTAPVSRSTIAGTVTGKRQFVFVAIDRLVDEGYATENGSGGIVLERAFSEADDA